MSKIIEQWLLFKYVGGEFTPLSKPFKTKEQAEKARLKYPETFDAPDPARRFHPKHATPSRKP
jgi:hypothetical protein